MKVVFTPVNAYVLKNRAAIDMKLRRIGLIDLFATIIGSVLLFVTKSFVGDPGVGWHLKTGQWIAEQRAVPQVDPFLFTTVDKPWVANQWLSDLLWWNVYAFGGWALIHVTFAGLVLSVYVFGLYPLLKRYSENTFVLFLVVLAASFVGSIQWIFRPVIFTLLFLTFTLRLSYAWWECSEESFPRVAKRTLLIFPILFLIWVNFHPGFPIGGVIFGLAVVGTIFRTDCSASEKQKRAFFGIATGVLMLIATLVNPYGYRVHENILALLGNNYFMNLNLEWFAADLYGLSFLPFFVVLFIAFYLYGRGRERVFHLFDVAIFALFLYLSLQQRRFIPFFGIVSSVFLVKLFSTVSEPTSLPTITRAFREISRKDRYSSQGGYFLFLWVLCMTGTIAMGTVPFRSMMFGPKRDFPTEAISAIAELEEPARIFHTPDWGGYFTLQLWPKQKAYIDDRNWLNTEKRYEDYFTAMYAKPGWKEVLREYDFEFVLTTDSSPLSLVLEKNDGWNIFHKDEKALVYRRITVD